MAGGRWKPTSVRRSLALLLIAGAVFSAAGGGVYAQERPPPEALAAENRTTGAQSEIEAKNKEIQRLQEEAEAYRVTLNEIGRAAGSLQSQVQALDQDIKRFDANIRLTSAKIGRANLEIAELGRGIQQKEVSIGTQRERLGVLVRVLAASDQETPLGIIIKHETLSSFFNAVDNLLGVQRDVQSALAELRQTREDLKERKGKAEDKKLELGSLLDDLADQKALQVDQRRERNVLFQETKNQERRYQELLAEVERKREALQQEINSLEAGLAVTFDRRFLPAPGSGILGWPLPEPVFITQRFGQTAFARSGAYSGKGHNGIDLRAANGTPVFAAERGTVRASGDTDTACRRASYGRWILIDHPSNLATLYSHLSLIKVRPGEGVNRGELIGYSGRTGYATGPHLHLSVFASGAVTIGSLKSRVCGRMMTLPLSPFGGYLNPLDYL